jgi:vacuolar-type H+-ATPase subunit H
MNNVTAALPGILDAQVQRLRDIVEAYRKEQCDQLVNKAQQESREFIRQAYRTARRNLHEDVQLTRQRIHDSLTAARAKQHTLMMQQRHAAALSFLELCWNSLADALQARWQQPRLRREWIEKIVFTAIAVVPGREWLVEHPQDWATDDQQQLSELVEAGSGVRPQFRIVPGLTAGIRISTDGAVIDGSLQGVMADRTGIESLILAKCPDHLFLDSD